MYLSLFLFRMLLSFIQSFMHLHRGMQSSNLNGRWPRTHIQPDFYTHRTDVPHSRAIVRSIWTFLYGRNIHNEPKCQPKPNSLPCSDHEKQMKVEAEEREEEGHGKIKQKKEAELCEASCQPSALLFSKLIYVKRSSNGVALTRTHKCKLDDSQ